MTDNVQIPFKEFYLLSPDGFTLTREAQTYNKIENAIDDFKEWQSQYANQGYYSSVKHGRIPLKELENYMIIHDQPFMII